LPTATGSAILQIVKLCRHLLLILLIVAVPVSGYASVTMQHCRDMAQGGGHTHHHHAGMPSGEMTASEHTHHPAAQKADAQPKIALEHCKCGCLCKGHCAPGSCAGALALLSNGLLPTSLGAARQMAPAPQPHTLAAHHLNRLRPPISAAT
jgi:hypothetical protein